MDGKAQALGAMPLFATLDPRYVEAVATLAREVTKPAGSVLMREGEPSESFYLIVSGTVHVERAGVPVRSMSEGGYLGEIGLVEGSARTATATCATDCRFLELGRFEFGRVTATFPEVRSKLDAALKRRPHD